MHRRAKAFRWLLMTIFLVIGTNAVFSQLPVVTITSPADGATEVPLTATINIEANMKIAVNSIHFDAYLREDSLVTKPSHTVLVIPKFVADSLPRSSWKHHAERGTLTLVDSAHLSFTVKLMAGMEYKTLVRDLKLIDSTGDTVDADPDSIMFTSVLPVHEPVQMSVVSGSTVGCQQTITIKFNRKVPLSTIAGNVVQIMRVDSFAVDTSSMEIDSTRRTVISSNYSLSGDSLTISITPSSALAPGFQYEVVCNTDYLTGVPAAKSYTPFNVYEGKLISIGMIPVGPFDPGFKECAPFPGVGNAKYQPGDSAIIHVPARRKNWCFKEWSSNDLTYDKSTQTTLIIPVTCSNLAPITLVAVFEKKSCDSFYLDAAGYLPGPIGGSVEWCDADLDSIGGPGLHTHCDGDDRVILADPDTLYRFHHWESSDSTINNKLTPWIKIKDLAKANCVSGQYTWVRAVFALLPCGSGTINAKVVVDNLQPGIAATDVVRLFPDNNGGALDESYTQAAPFSRTFQVTIQSAYKDCYEIYEVTKGEETNGGTDYEINVPDPCAGGACPTDKLTIPVTADCNADLEVRVRRKKFKLTVERAEVAGLTILGPIPYDWHANAKATINIKYNPADYITDYATFPYSSPHDQVPVQVYEFWCNANVTAEAKGFKLGNKTVVEFRRWTCAGSPTRTCTNAGSSDPTINPLNMVMDRDRYIQGEFEEGFRLVNIWLKTIPAPTLTSYDADNGFTSTKKDVIVESGTPDKGVIVRLDFSGSVDVANLAGGENGLPSKIAFVEESNRIDNYCDSTKRKIYTIGNATSVTWSNWGPGANSRLELTLIDGSIGVPKLELVGIMIASTLKNTGGQSIANPGRRPFRTQYPKLKVIYDYVVIKETSDNIADETIDLWAAMHINGQTGARTVTKGKLPTVNGWTPTVDNQTVNYNITMLDIQLGEGDKVTWGAITVDHDDGNTPPGITTILNDVAATIGSGSYSGYIGNTFQQKVDPYLNCPTIFCDDDDINAWCTWGCPTYFSETNRLWGADQCLYSLTHTGSTSEGRIEYHFTATLY